MSSYARPSALLVAVAMFACACAEAVDVGSGVATTLHFDSSVSDATLAEVRMLSFTTDEPYESDLTLSRTLSRTERTVYRPFAKTRTLSITVSALDVGGLVLAQGNVLVPVVTPGQTEQVEVVLTRGALPDLGGDLPHFEDPTGDLAGADLAGADLAQPDLGVVSVIPPYLGTKALSGKPNAAATIVFQGESPRLQLVFRTSVNVTAYISTVTAAGGVTLPPHAGLYRTELTDISTGRVSYGTATVNDTFSTWSPSTTVLSHAFGVYRTWPGTSVTTGDLRHNGYVDVAYASGVNDTGVAANPGVYVYKFDSTSQAFTLAQTLSAAAPVMAATFADVTGDGWLDLVYSVNTTTATANVSNRLFVAVNDGAGTFLAPTSTVLTTPAGAGPTYLNQALAADLNRDGRTDLVLVGGTNNAGTCTAALVYVLFGTAGGGFSTTLLEVASTLPYSSVDVADANDDGQLDIYAYGGPGQSLSRFYQQGIGQFSRSALGTDYDTNASAHGNYYYDAIKTGYIYGKSRPDVVAVHTDGPSTVFAASATTNALTATVIPAPTTGDQHGTCPVIADLSGDGVQEIYIPLKNRALYVNKPGAYTRTSANLTTAVAASATNTITGYSTIGSWSLSSIFMEDFNNDGKIDLFMPVAYMALSNLVFAN